MFLFACENMERSQNTLKDAKNDRLMRLIATTKRNKN
jgi:hypothetical protein